MESVDALRQLSLVVISFSIVKDARVVRVFVSVGVML